MKPIFLTALDIGTFSVKGMAAEKDIQTGEIEVLAKVELPCFGVRSGEIIKPDRIAPVLSEVKKELFQRAGIKIKGAVVNLGGSHLFSFASQGLVSVSRADQRISQEDIDRVIKAAQAVNLPSNKEVVETIIQEYIIDGEGGIKEPLGLQGIRLEVKALLICLFSPVLENLEKAFALSDLAILQAVPSPLASSRAVLSPEQKELGSAVLDIGSGVTSLSIFEKGELAGFAVFPIGSANITNDIAIGLRTEIKTAEKIKREFGYLGAGWSKKSKKPPRSRGDKIEVAEKDLSFSRKFLRNIIESRISQIFNECQKAMKKICPAEQLPGGIIITGGGSEIKGITDFTKQKFKLPARLAKIQEVASVEERGFAGCCGLLLSGFDSFAFPPRQTAVRQGLRERIKRLFRVFLP